MVTNPEAVSAGLMEFPVLGELDDAKRIFAEHAILGGMLRGDERFIRAGANTDWTFPMAEAIARACVEAWERFGAQTVHSIADEDAAWRCDVSSYIARYTGRSPLMDHDMYHWVFYMLSIYRMKFPEPEEQEVAS